MKGKTRIAGTVINGTVVEVTADFVIVDVGLKSEGRIAKHEFSKPGEDSEIKPGDNVEVFVERIEGRNGESVLSREKRARHRQYFRPR